MFVIFGKLKYILPFDQLYRYNYNILKLLLYRCNYFKFSFKKKILNINISFSYGLRCVRHRDIGATCTLRG